MSRLSVIAALMLLMILPTVATAGLGICLVTDCIADAATKCKTGIRGKLADHRDGQDAQGNHDCQNCCTVMKPCKTIVYDIEERVVYETVFEDVIEQAVVDRVRFIDDIQYQCKKVNTFEEQTSPGCACSSQQSCSCEPSAPKCKLEIVTQQQKRTVPVKLVRGVPIQQVVELKRTIVKRVPVTIKVRVPREVIEYVPVKVPCKSCSACGCN